MLFSVASQGMKVHIDKLKNMRIIESCMFKPNSLEQGKNKQNKSAGFATEEKKKHKQEQERANKSRF